MSRRNGDLWSDKTSENSHWSNLFLTVYAVDRKKKNAEMSLIGIRHINL